MTVDILLNIRENHPDLEVVQQTEQGTLIRSNGDGDRYFVIPPCFVSDYEAFKRQKPAKFRAFLYFIGSVCRDLNKKATEGLYREKMNDALADMQGYYAEICLEQGSEPSLAKPLMKRDSYGWRYAYYQQNYRISQQHTCE